MGIIGGEIGYRVLRAISHDGRNDYCASGTPAASKGRSTVEVVFGQGVWDELSGVTVIDFGCRRGGGAVGIALNGAARAGVPDRCEFVTETSERADVVVSLDAFGHCADLAGVLRAMSGLVRDEGRALIVFGPT
jgi:hypothetical protein